MPETVVKQLPKRPSLVPPISESPMPKKKIPVIELFLRSTILKMIASILLFFLLFAVTFTLAYWQTQKDTIQKSRNEVPEAEITVPDIVKYANPTLTPTTTETPQGHFCGGIAGVECPDGFQCKLDGNYPDAGGVCISEKTSGTCKPTGCSGEICSDQDIASTCVFKEEYACYQNAKCERQSDGKCGWTQTDELKMCVANKDQMTN